MADEIKPALTPEEWEKGRWGDADYADQASGAVYLDGFFWPHGLAARLLHGQPFGFDWQDVDDLREVDCCPAHTRSCRNLADRIAALLPPREK